MFSYTTRNVYTLTMFFTLLIFNILNYFLVNIPNSNEIKEIAKEHKDYDIDIALIKEKLKVINEEVSELQNVVRSIEEKPIENFDKIKMYVVTTAISAIIGFIINKLLEK